MAFYLVRIVIGRMAGHLELMVLAHVCLLIGVVAGWHIHYRQLVLPVARMQQIMALAILCYLIVDPADLTVAQTQQATAAKFIDFAYWVAVLCAFLGLFRPAAVVFPAFHIYLMHLKTPSITGFTADRLASVTLVESAQFLAMSIIVLGTLQLMSRSFGLHSVCVKRFKNSFDELLLGCLFIAISLHLSHYFWSGYEKFNLGEQVWDWVNYNQTHNLILSTLYRDTLPSAQFPAITQWLFEQMSTHVQWLNAASALVQLLAIVAVLHVAAIRIFSLLYDAFHIGIFIATGLLLWPWVANNIAILYALKSMGPKALTWPIKLCCLLTIVLGGFHYFGNASRLAWWDLRDITGTFAQARTADGQWRTIPLSFFNAHGRLVSLDSAQVHMPGHYASTGWGATDIYDSARMSGECVPAESAIAAGDYETQDARDAREERIKAFLVAHHRKLVLREQRYSKAHPFPALRYQSSSTYLPEGIERVEQIDAYRFVMQSVCLDLVEGQLEKTVVKEDSFIVQVGPQP